MRAVGESKDPKMKAWLENWGPKILLLSWFPGLGDPYAWQLDG
jgi:membrane protein YqaA with SNARE-associated domain